MVTLQDVVNKLKINSANTVELKLINTNYGIVSCNAESFKTFNSNKLEIIFLSNINYMCLLPSEMNTVLTGNYKDLFKIDCLSSIDDIKLEKPIVVNNTTVVNNYVTNNVVQEDYWDQTDF